MSTKHKQGVKVVFRKVFEGEYEDRPAFVIAYIGLSEWTDDEVVSNGKRMADSGADTFKRLVGDANLLTSDFMALPVGSPR